MNHACCIIIYFVYNIIISTLYKFVYKSTLYKFVYISTLYKFVYISTLYKFVQLRLSIYKN